MITANEAKALVEKFKEKERERLNKELQKIEETIVVAAEQGMTSYLFDHITPSIRERLSKNGFRVENRYADHDGNDTSWQVSWD